MASQSNAPVIIKRKKVVGGGGHHGGAWKVAYADFVTAMMAFFMLMWLLNATTETQRQGIADYFSPTIPLSRVSGGGDGALGGENLFSDEALARSGVGGSRRFETRMDSATASSTVDDEGEVADAQFTTMDEMLTGRAGESMVSDDLLRHIVTRVTDEGLIVDLFDLPDARLFENNSDEPTPLLGDLIDVVSEVFQLATNEVAINGHVRSVPIVVQDNPVWSLSAERAQMVRQMLKGADFPAERVQRIGGYADREPMEANRLDVRNNRIELILLR